MNERQIYTVKINIQTAAEKLTTVQTHQSDIKLKSAKNVSFFLNNVPHMRLSVLSLGSTKVCWHVWSQTVSKS